jgi:hypothetical protein
LKSPNWKPELIQWAQAIKIQNDVGFLADVLKYKENPREENRRQIRSYYLAGGKIYVPPDLWQ